MTLLLPAEKTRKPPISAELRGFRVPLLTRGPSSRVVADRVALAVLLIGTAALYLWNLSASGWANSFYSAAAQAGANNWTAMLFGSSDAANAITVDKTPASLWVMDVSVRIFGLNPWSVLAPQALEGVAAVAILYAAVRRVSGPGAALLAGSIMALTPVAALMFRFNNPDALLVLMLVAAAYCTQRACEKDSSRWWLVAAGAAVGFGFLAKMLQAFLVLPGFVAAYLISGSRPLSSSAPRRRESGRGDGRRSRLVPRARRGVAVRRPTVHRRIPARQHRRTGFGLQRVRPADRGTRPAASAT